MNRILVLTLLVAITTAGCERIPGDPLDDPEAAALLERMRAAAAGRAPLPSLAELYDVATFAGSREHRPLLARADTLHAAALEVLAAPNGEDAELAVTAARAARIRAVVAVLGTPAVASLIAHGQMRAGLLDSRIGAGAGAPLGLARMNDAATDMLERARLEFLRGQNEAALDLAAHAVDLLNHVERTLDAS